MVATSAHHVVRVTVRIDVVSFHRDVDLTLPTSSTLSEVFPELARMVELPEVHRPWQATTVAGAPLDMNTPLYQHKLRDGSVIVLRPQELVHPPVVRDAAESLAAAADGAASLRGLDAVTSLVGCAVLAAAVAPFIGVVAACAGAAAAAAVLGLYSGSRLLYLAGALAASAACGAWVAGPPAQWAATDPALGVLAAAATLAVLTGGGVLVSLLDAPTTAASLTTALLCAAAAAGAWLPSPSAPAAVAVTGALLAAAAAPGVATRAAGLRVPRIPTAGEELAAADGYQPDVDARARRARATLAGIAVGCALVAAPALVWLAWDADVWATVLCLCVLGAVAFHATRHHYRVPRVALSAIALAAALACGIAAARMEPTHPAAVVLAGIVGLACASAVAWAPRLPDLEPTTVVWLERAEAVALVAALPVAAYVVGVFDLVRGF
ncbi:type VII secretion integral membrane protein EccD [Corynebacterium timonense]|uniref:Type VII secretion integral membrane protein EccD n=1 Tax=Corynebacterium timonense TaxID=441500 RepID=A0A1H1SK27_9CORY|nr:type VII secretion integral membrane protein EccD [Corynebacterium timonense]SDS48345.1 type VII secretion integral membrane protein EccD [Corynebacterium timonense]